ELRAAANDGRNIMPASIVCAKAGVTTGEWGAAFRGVFGEYRAPTGVAKAARQVGGAIDDVRTEVQRVSTKIGKRAKFLIGKPGLDGHSNGAEQIAVRARDAGFDVIYAGIRSTPAEIVDAARQEGVHCVGLSILSGSHVTLAHEVIRLMKDRGLDKVPLVVGGIIPPADEKRLRDEGVAAVYTPKNYDLNAIMTDLAHIIERSVERAS
ncbi:MAG: cobalamin B12-binding domain-containing protein, partial [Methylocystis sp.]|nr:cobalamin B12-binding domain-containing protein [Methylocystis sp.]